jgi:TonB family protein
MKKNLIIALLAVCGYTTQLQAQTDSTANTKAFYTTVDKLPEFPGGIQELYKYLGSTLRYPKTAQKNKVEGRVIIGIIIQADGSVSDVVVKKSSASPELDAEAVRVMELSPKWSPGEQDGHPVRVAYSIPIVFSLKKS